MSSTPRLHPTPVTPRWPEVPAANSCYTSSSMHSTRYGNSSDMYTPLTTRRNSEYEHMQHFPGFAYINGEATTGWAKWRWLVPAEPTHLQELQKLHAVWDFSWTFFKGGENGKDPRQINVVPNVGRPVWLNVPVAEKYFCAVQDHFLGWSVPFLNSGPTLCAPSLSEPFLPLLLLMNINESYKKKKSTETGLIYHFN